MVALSIQPVKTTRGAFVDFVSFVRLIARNLLVVLSLVVVGGLVGWGAGSREVPYYQAQAKILFSLRTTESGVGAGNQDLIDRMPTYANLALTSSVLDEAVTTTSYPGGVDALRSALEAV